ncbi:E3 ubiquitin-protein ligase ZNF598 [Drosophila guanche]|uniref:RING-type E3 ubiquitin transferase n=1 Tax=Drosophila guanche TaxID=7266 RepID=A0A3B0JTQ9_DROGU|nr:E3 ubiquitin-protein ligase ZNF598 [Drosophila guanche]SPP74468.1 blast:Zinc finger protein 598 [Drosophila guanche]
MHNFKQRGTNRGNQRRPRASTNNAGDAAAAVVKHAEIALDTTNDDNACVVCFKNFDIYSIGDCDHPVCYECSTRMRVLCQQNECPICRHVLSKVLFTLEKLPYRELEANSRSDFYSKKYRIGFCTAEIQQKFFQLLDHPCPKCEAPPYRTFAGLRNHVRSEHNLHYCDLCVETLKIFTFERRCYTQSELSLHNNKGDPDNRSHRGHPLCEYCKKRYVDRDELFRHLRREHYFCHFCDADGCNEFYNDYTDLADHFRQEHFLCEEGKCATEQFVGAFRNEIEYKAHVANMHSKTLNKQQAKQTRTLQLEITLGPRGRTGQNEQGIANMRARNDENNDYLDDFASSSLQQRGGHAVSIDAGNEEQFPTLRGAAAGPSVSLVRPPPPSMRNLSGSSGLARTKENFPALGGGNSGAVAAGGSSLAARAAQSQHPVSAVFKKSASAASGGNRAGQSSNNEMLLHVSNRPAASKKPATPQFDFPALPAGKGKKNMRNLEEDMLPSTSAVPMTNVSAKHRLLVDDYVSVANPSTYHKLQMVQKEESEAKARAEAMKKNAPKLTSAEFPTLGPCSSTSRATAPRPSNGSAALNWSKPTSEKKQRELENRKAKVAPPPMLPTPKSVPKASNNNQEPQASKKDKKPKEKKSNQENQPKVGQPKPKEKNNNNNNEQKPPLNGNASTPARTPPALAGPGAGAGAGAGPLKPPPGFISNVTVNSVAKLPNKLTFTSSLGESYDIVPSTYSYTDPPDTPARNQNLVDKFREILKTPEALNEFRSLSFKFRDGSCNGQAYYEHCQCAMLEAFHGLFPELLVMLPDINKQQELYLVYKQNLSKISTAQRKSLPSLEVCAVCKQVLLSADLDIHQQAHALSQNFPKLGGSSKPNLQRH